jgi:hypothetical protein
MTEEDKKVYKIATKTKCYETFYARNLRIFDIGLCVCPWQAFPASLMFAGKASSLR